MDTHRYELNNPFVPPLTLALETWFVISPEGWWNCSPSPNWHCLSPSLSDLCVALAMVTPYSLSLFPPLFSMRVRWLSDCCSDYSFFGFIFWLFFSFYMQAFPKVLPLTLFSPPSKPSPLVISSIFMASLLIGMQSTPTSMTSAIHIFPQGLSLPFPTAWQVALLALQCAPNHTPSVSLKPPVSLLGTQLLSDISIFQVTFYSSLLLIPATVSCLDLLILCPKYLLALSLNSHCHKPHYYPINLSREYFWSPSVLYSKHSRM